MALWTLMHTRDFSSPAHMSLDSCLSSTSGVWKMNAGLTVLNFVFVFFIWDGLWHITQRVIKIDQLTQKKKVIFGDTCFCHKNGGCKNYLQGTVSISRISIVVFSQLLTHNCNIFLPFYVSLSMGFRMFNGVVNSEVFIQKI